MEGGGGALGVVYTALVGGAEGVVVAAITCTGAAGAPPSSGTDGRRLSLLAAGTKSAASALGALGRDAASGASVLGALGNDSESAPVPSRGTVGNVGGSGCFGGT